MIEEIKIFDKELNNELLFEEKQTSKFQDTAAALCAVPCVVFNIF